MTNCLCELNNSDCPVNIRTTQHHSQPGVTRNWNLNAEFKTLPFLKSLNNKNTPFQPKKNKTKTISQNKKGSPRREAINEYTHSLHLSSWIEKKGKTA